MAKKRRNASRDLTRVALVFRVPHQVTQVTIVIILTFVIRLALVIRVRHQVTRVTLVIEAAIC